MLCLRRMKTSVTICVLAVVAATIGAPPTSKDIDLEVWNPPIIKFVLVGEINCSEIRVDCSRATGSLLKQCCISPPKGKSTKYYVHSRFLLFRTCFVSGCTCDQPWWNYPAENCCRDESRMKEMSPDCAATRLDCRKVQDYSLSLCCPQPSEWTN